MHAVLYCCDFCFKCMGDCPSGGRGELNTIYTCTKQQQNRTERSWAYFARYNAPCPAMWNVNASYYALLEVTLCRHYDFGSGGGHNPLLCIICYYHPSPFIYTIKQCEAMLYIFPRGHTKRKITKHISLSTSTSSSSSRVLCLLHSEKVVTKCLYELV